VLAALMVSLLLLVSCGASDESDLDTSSAPTENTSAKAVFIKKANDACRQTSKTIRRATKSVAVEQVGEESTDALARDIVSLAIVPGLEAQVTGIEDAKPPPGEARDVKAVLAAIQATIADASRDPVAFVRQGDSFAASSAAAAKYGFTACGHP
jgi:hypothetical protein